MRRKPKEPKDASADLLSVPGMEKLDELTREVLKVPKSEIERREAEEKAKRERKNCAETKP